ncbi:MAG: DUF4386 domain-containing protein [Mameliella sp.]|nr:DUF4386 domain-containing protein [Phaeodactylibacter sp.]
MTDQKKLARVAGTLYLLVILFGVFAELFVRAKLFIPDAAAMTASLILSNEFLFRMGFVSDLFMQVAFFFLPLSLYHLLGNEHRGYGLVMLGSAWLSVGVMCINMLNQYAALLMLKNGEDWFSYDQPVIEGWALMFMELQKNGYRIGQLFFGLWLLPLGLLIRRSSLIPNWIGWGLIISFLSFELDFLLFFLWEDYTGEASSLVTFPTVIGEFALCGFLLIKGVRTTAPA